LNNIFQTPQNETSASVIASPRPVGSVFQVRFECSERGRVPMLATFGAGRLVELKFVVMIPFV
jgi:hypothetical protein